MKRILVAVLAVLGLGILFCFGGNSHDPDPRVKSVLKAHKQGQWDLDVSKLTKMSEPIIDFEKRMTGKVEVYNVPHPSNIEDYFRYRIMMSKDGGEFWILRYGGFAGVSELYGIGVLDTNGTIRYVEPANSTYSSPAP